MSDQLWSIKSVFMLNKQRVLIASLIAKIADASNDPIERNALKAAAHEMVGQDRDAVEFAPSSKQLEETGLTPTKGFESHYDDSDSYSINRTVVEKANNRYKTAQNSTSNGRS